MRAMTEGRRLRVLGVAGSLREASLNRALLRAAAEVAPESISLEIFSLHGVPLYDGDVEAQGDPERVVAWKAAIAGADALLFASPEYNFGMSGVLKNAIDWASRPPGKSVLAGKPTAIVGASPGGAGTRFSQAALRHTLSALAVPVLPAPLFFLGQAPEKFEDGRLVDERSLQLLRGVLVALAAWTERLRAGV
jgi:chromate reductase